MARMSKTGSRRLLLGTAAVALLHLLISAQNGFVPVEGAGLSRRLAAGVLPLFFSADAAMAIPRVTDREEFINRMKRENVPTFKQGIDYLKKIDQVDDRMRAFVPRMIRKMDIYANIQSRSEAPDRTVRRLVADMELFRKAVEEKKDKQAALKAWDAYVADLPIGIAKFDLDEPESFEGPQSDSSEPSDPA